MEQLHIIKGFTEIKSELIKKCNLSKSHNELALWFSFENDVLYVHDKSEHIKCIALALYYSDGSWVIFLEAGYGKSVILHAINISLSTDEVSKTLNSLFESHGFTSFTRF